jgi:DNA end-binding protein Ku
MAARANWKGFLKVGELTCPVALYTAASTSERIAFHTLNRATGNRVRREFVDQVTPASRWSKEAQVKGYETAKDELRRPHPRRKSRRPFPTATRR